MENYSLLMGAAAVMKMAVEMAAVSMEKPSGGIPAPGAEQRLLSPDLGFAMAAARKVSRTVASSMEHYAQTESYELGNGGSLLFERDLYLVSEKLERPPPQFHGVRIHNTPGGEQQWMITADLKGNGFGSSCRCHQLLAKDRRSLRLQRAKKDATIARLREKIRTLEVTVRTQQDQIQEMEENGEDIQGGEDFLSDDNDFEEDELTEEDYEFLESGEDGIIPIDVDEDDEE
ncbi:hypothetical protein QYE76_051991 [Lolium multiflorum]|uniref:Uncharacterized protein n=1 Tax=Lolium multiflorum TaxID=4521 RepID=A0AAD8WIF8_LOLMU|nr:hypothetical protein QYE76_051991 [Lolium multiflorum]